MSDPEDIILQAYIFEVLKDDLPGFWASYLYGFNSSLYRTLYAVLYIYQIVVAFAQ